MDHKVTNVQLLYDDAKSLYNNVVLGKADVMINDLNRSINSLKGSWEGKDAGIQIQNVVDVHNAMVKLRNALVELAKDSSRVASRYREIQNANRANLETLAPLTSEGEKFPMENYVDNRDTINITSEAMNGKNILDGVNNQFEDFKNEVRKLYDNIMNNWQVGTGRERTASAFSEFMSSSDKYKEILREVSQSIADALKNYTI